MSNKSTGASRYQIKKNVAHSVVAFGLNVVLVFISYRLIIKQGGVSSLGLWSTLMAWIYLIRMGDVGMSSATIKFVASCDVVDAKASRKYIDTGLVANAALFFFLSIVGYWILSGRVVSLLPHNTAPDVLLQARAVLPVMFVGFFFTNISGLILGSLQGLHKGYIGARISVIGTVLQLFSVVLLVPNFKLLGMAWALIIQHAVMTLVGWYFIAKFTDSSAKLPRAVSVRVFKEMFSFSSKVQLVNLLNGAFEPLSKILVSRFGGLELQGFFEMAYKTVSLPRNVVVSGATATLPAMTSLFAGSHRELSKLYIKTRKRVWQSSAAAFVLTCIAAPIISVAWLGGIHYEYFMFVVIIGLGFLGNSYGAVAYNIGLASGVIKNNLLAVTIALMILIVFGFFAGKFSGSIGVAVCAGVGLMLSGIFVKIMNERLIIV